MELNFIEVSEFEWQIIANPNACDKKCLSNWDIIENALTENHIKHAYHKADGCHKGIELARTLCQEGHRHLLVVGGDGTINEVVNGIMSSGVDPAEVYLAVIPHGRGNDWARSHSFPKDIADSFKGFLKGSFTRHDIGLTKVFAQDQLLEERFFININSYCFSAEVIYQTNVKKPKFLNISVYVLGIFQALRNYRYIPVKIRGNNISYDDEPFMFVVANCQYNGGGMRQAPEAQYNDGLFDVVIIPKLGTLKILFNIRYIFTGRHIQKLKNVQFFRTDKLSIESEPFIRGEMEGEMLKQGRYDIEMIPNALNVMTLNKA